MLGMLECKGHNVQEQTQSSHPTFQDFQTSKIDITQKMQEMSGMWECSWLATKNHQKQILATPFKYSKK